MKKFFILLFILAAYTSKANTIEISREALTTFRMAFKSAANADWQVRSSYYQVSFYDGSRQKVAYISLDGKLIGTSKCISIHSLPAMTKKAVAKKFPSYTIATAIQMTSENAEDIYITIQKGDESLVLKMVIGDVVIAQ